jgi:subtilisin family serine protease
MNQVSPISGICQGDFYGDKAETIKWKEAMELYSSKKNTVVAVVDSGIANFHPELEFKIAGMLAEQPSNGGISGQDDDGFGKVDDTHGWNFTANESNNEIENFPEDDHGHGTLVSGIISSESSNNEGFTGIAPDSYILPLRVRDGKSVSDLRIIEAVEYSIAANVKVINVSMRFLSYLQFSFVLQEATENLHLNHDCLIICAAGNYSENNDNTPTYPASYEGDAIISVAASDQNNELAKFSNFGLESVDLAAPGVDIWGPTISRNKTPVIEEYFDYNLGEWSWGSTPYNLSNYYWNYFVDAYGKTWVTDSDYDVNYDLLNYSPYSDTFLKSPIIDLRNVNFPELSVTVYHDLAYNWLLGSYDMLFFEISKDGINWFKLGSGVYGKTPYPGRRYSFDLSEFKNELVEVRFRISSDGIYQSDGVYIDDFIITGTSPFTYTGNEYKSNDGTSFAAPIVSGVAAMLLVTQTRTFNSRCTKDYSSISNQGRWSGR